jgi:hypothetical protein
MVDDRLADPLGHPIAAGDGHAVRFGLVGGNLDEIVVAQHIGEFEQRRRDFDRVVGEFVDDIAGRPIERRQKLCHMRTGLDLDELGQLAKHFVVLRDLLVVAAI